MLKELQRRVGRGFSDAKSFLGNAYNIGSKIASTVDRHAGTIRRIVGAVAPMAGALTGPVGSAVGAGLGMAEAMGHMNQVAQVALAGKRALK